jgi:hypothetical protein
MTKHIASLTIERGDAGLWYVTSPEWRGLFLAHRNLAAALAEVVPTIQAMHAAMTDWQSDPANKPYEEAQLDQMERYASVKDEAVK